MDTLCKTSIAPPFQEAIEYIDQLEGFSDKLFVYTVCDEYAYYMSLFKILPNMDKSELLQAFRQFYEDLDKDLAKHLWMCHIISLYQLYKRKFKYDIRAI